MLIMCNYTIPQEFYEYNKIEKRVILAYDAKNYDDFRYIKTIYKYKRL